MKRLFISVCLAFTLTLASAVTVNDIPSILYGAQALYEDASEFLNFAILLRSGFDQGFSITLFGSSETVAIPAQQRAGLIARYMNLKQKMQNDFNQLP